MIGDLYHGCVCIYGGTVELLIFACDFAMLKLLLGVNECVSFLRNVFSSMTY